ncbi:hypothetical protein [Stenotrophomonas sp. 22385]|uniref:hypothetical protein n=1 Tax=Stenotrophomonas sp. 22385 TaxID=3453915 RepID=UPI003F846D42
MDMRIRQWKALDYFDPAPVLIGLRDYERSGALQDVPYEVASLRTRELKPYGERRQCAMFAYLMGRVTGTFVSVAYCEASDYDAVMHHRVGDEIRFVPVQMKELPPSFLPFTKDLQGLIDGLKDKYPTSSDLTVAVYVNRDVSFRVQHLDLSGLNLGALWLFGGCDQTGDTWRVIGNLLSGNCRTEVFGYPAREAAADGSVG